MELNARTMSGGSGPSEDGWPSRPSVPHALAVELLERGDVELVGRMPWSSNATFLVDLVDSEHRLAAVYKPRRGERPLWDFPSGTLCQREVAAYELSAALGWELVPETVLRDGPAGEGSVQRFVDHDPQDHYFSLLEAGEHSSVLRRFAAFDVVANNTDRKAGHVIRATDGHVWGIDHGVCFHTDWKVRTVIWDFGGDPLGDEVTDALARFLSVLDGDGAQRFARLLSPREIAAMRARAEWLADEGCFPSVEPGHHSYPWPLV